MDNKYSLIFYPAASEDIENIIKYISVDLSNPVAASKLLEDFDESFKTLLAFPKIYPLIDNQFVKDKMVRRMLVRNYAVFYKIADNMIQVIRIVHVRSDYTVFLS